MVVLFEISLQSQGQDTSIRSEPADGQTPTPPAPTGETRQQPPGPAAPDIGDACLKQLPFLLPVILIMYFLMIRPQQKQEKARREMLSKVQKGDRVVTNSGIHGVVATVSEDSIQIFIDSEAKTKITVDRAAIGRLLDREAAPKSNATGS